MTKKDDLQAELLAKVKPGTKPSHLKRSKSADDIPSPLNQLTELKKQTDLNALLQEQLKEKQREVESLRKQLETANNSPGETLTELDHSLMARHQSLKD